MTLPKRAVTLAALALLSATPIMAQQQPAPAPGTVEITEKANARHLLLEAGAALIDGANIGNNLSGKPLEALVTKNRRALELTRQALQVPHEGFLASTEEDIARQMEEHRITRQLARLLGDEGRFKAEVGDEAGAVQSYLDTLQLGQHIRRDASLIGILVSNAVESIAQAHLGKLLPNLNAIEAQAAVQRIEGLLAKRLPFAQSLQAEADFGAQRVRQLAQVPDHAPLRAGFADELEAHYRELMAWETAQAVQPYILSNQKPAPNEQLAAEMEAAVDAAQEAPGQPNAANALDTRTIAERVFAPIRPVIHRARLNEVRTQTFNALLLTSLALHAYQLENKEEAAELKQLVPKYLKAVPLDPFGHEEPLRYTVRDGEYVLYSIGPDGLNDEGARLSTYDAKRHRYVGIESNSRGDIVALYRNRVGT